MSKRRKRQTGGTNGAHSKPDAAVALLNEQYARACRLAAEGARAQARQIYEELIPRATVGKLRALIENDLATLAALDGDLDTARERLKAALDFDPDCVIGRENLALLAEVGEEGTSQTAIAGATATTPAAAHRTKVAIVSTLFNWPSTGGGTIHTAETGKFLSRAGYEVRHFYANYPDWGIGRMEQEPLVASEPIVFDQSSWNAAEIQRRFRQAVDAFAPDFVILTDSWNFKPLLAEAMQGYRYFLRLAAQECLCPLNNVRLLVEVGGRIAACPRHQLATPDICRQCVGNREHQSGSLHQAERALSGYGTPEYDQKLRRAFAEAEAVLVVNPLIATMISPYAKQVCVAPSGFDPERFPWPWPELKGDRTADQLTKLFFAGLTEEYMKGFHVLQAACAKLWQKRQDFEIVATGDPPGPVNEFTRYIGWQTQEQLPQAIRAADILVFPTVAEEALGRSAVEAMGVGRPVIASRIGGLQFTVTDGATGLLFEPGSADDLADKIELLLDNTELRRRMGEAGRQRFEEHYTWDAIIERHYKRLFGPPVSSSAGQETEYVRVTPACMPQPESRTSTAQAPALGCVLAIQNRPAPQTGRPVVTASAPMR